MSDIFQIILPDTGGGGAFTNADTLDGYHASAFWRVDQTVNSSISSSYALTASYSLNSNNNTGNYTGSINFNSIDDHINLNERHNFVVGEHSGLNNSSYGSIIIGSIGWSTPESRHSKYNTLIGYGAGVQIASSGPNEWDGAHNIAIGVSAAAMTTRGNKNVAIGISSLFYNILGSQNIAIGPYAGYYNTSSNRLYISNDSGTSIIYGDLQQKRLGINVDNKDTSSLSGTLHIFGNVYANSYTGNLNGSSSYATTSSYSLGSVTNFSTGNYTGSFTGNLNSNNIVVDGDVHISGHLFAGVKHFEIDDRYSDNKIIYTTLEGKDRDVFYRGKIESYNEITTINLPEEWSWMVDEKTISINITPINFTKFKIKKITNKKINIKIKNKNKIKKYFYIIFATMHKDV